MSTVRHIGEIDRINRLYSIHDAARETNVVSFSPPPNPNILGLLDDVEVLLSDPQTREVTENTLRAALQHIAAQFINR